MSDEKDIQSMPIQETSPTNKVTYDEFISRQSPEFQAYIQALRGDIFKMLHVAQEVLDQMKDESDDPSD